MCTQFECILIGFAIGAYVIECNAHALHGCESLDCINIDTASMMVLFEGVTV